jgi:hypothetical protein
MLDERDGAAPEARARHARADASWVSTRDRDHGIELGTRNPEVVAQ